MSGLSLVTESPAFRVVRVLRVLPHSPAEEVGLMAGDEIVTFGGRPAGEYRLAALRELLRQADRKYSLQIKRGAQIVSVELKTRRLV
jgi:C-terminal processing protease CtpA/Prc